MNQRRAAMHAAFFWNMFNSRVSLATRLWFILGSSLLGAGGLCIYLLVELTALDKGYRAILDTQVREQASARVMQVAFKKQVQEWKNVLLRGHDAKDREKYATAFRLERQMVRAYTDSLSSVDDPDARLTVRRFSVARDSLDTAYDRGLVIFGAANGRNPYTVDSLLRGKDRAPTDLIDTLVSQLHRSADTRVASQQEAVGRQRLTLEIAAAVMIVVLLAVPFVLVRTIVTPVRRLEEAARSIADGDLRATITHVSNDELGDLADTFRRMRDSLRSLLGEIVSGSGLVSDTARSLSSGSAQINSATMEVAQAAHAIAEAASQQTNSANEILASSQRVAHGARDISTDARDAEQAARTVRMRAERGQRAAAEIGERLGEISDAASQTGPAIDELHEKSRRIREFTDVIATIASQSKLLALNAAIEAARAGDHGRGFGVVADEVGKLARDSQEALAAIRVLVSEVEASGEAIGERVDEMHGAVEAGTASFRTAGSVLDEILGDAARSAAASERIVAATVAQQQESDSLAAAMESIAATAEENAATAEQVSASTEQQTAAMQSVAEHARELALLAGRLNEAGSRFAL